MSTRENAMLESITNCGANRYALYAEDDYVRTFLTVINDAREAIEYIGALMTAGTDEFKQYTIYCVNGYDLVKSITVCE